MGRSRLLHLDRAVAPAIVPAGPRPLLPLATYLLNAGLSERDARQAEAYVLGEARKRIAKKALHDDAGQRFRYLNDARYRAQVNREVIAEVLLEFGFSREELRVMDEGLKLSLTEILSAAVTVA